MSKKVVNTKKSKPADRILASTKPDTMPEPIIGGWSIRAKDYLQVAGAQIGDIVSFEVDVVENPEVKAKAKRIIKRYEILARRVWNPNYRFEIRDEKRNKVFGISFENTVDGVRNYMITHEFTLKAPIVKTVDSKISSVILGGKTAKELEDAEKKRILKKDNKELFIPEHLKPIKNNGPAPKIVTDVLSGNKIDQHLKMGLRLEDFKGAYILPTKSKKTTNGKSTKSNTGKKHTAKTTGKKSTKRSVGSR